MLVLRVRKSWVSVQLQGCAKLPMKQRKDWNEKVVKDSNTRPIMTARASPSNFERSCNSKLFQSWWSCQYRRLHCSADLAARGAAPFVLMKFNQWRQRLNFTVPSCIMAKIFVRNWISYFHTFSWTYRVKISFIQYHARYHAKIMHVFNCMWHHPYGFTDNCSTFRAPRKHFSSLLVLNPNLTKIPLPKP